MDKKIIELSSTTFCGRRFTRQQLTDIQTMVRTLPALSRRELGHTVCEYLKWTTPRCTDKIQTCLNLLDELELLGIVTLPMKIEQKNKGYQKEMQWSEHTNEGDVLHCTIAELMPISLQVVTDKENAEQWNEFVDRYHYLGYRRPRGSYLRYYINDRHGRKLGCLLFSFASTTLDCRDKWIGWTEEHRQKHLNLVINNNRFLIFPWVNVKHLASKALAHAMRQVADDWEIYHGYRPVLVETFVDPTKYKGTCYQASNWQHIGETDGRSSKIAANNRAPKDVYIYPLDTDVRETLMDKKISPVKKTQSFKTANIAPESQVYLWQKIITVVSAVAEDFDKEWQKRRRVLSTLLIILFIFRLVFSKNKQGYATTITELWEYCNKLNIELPQSKPVVAAAFGNARMKLDETVFKTLNTKIIQTYEAERDDYRWKNHRIFAVDGSKINLPRQLQKYAYRTPSDNAYYPQGLMSCLYQLKSKIPMDFDLTPHHDERKMALNHLEVIQQNDIVVYDRGYFSYAMLHAHHKKGIHAVFRVSKSSIKIIDEFMLSDDTERLITIDPNAQSKKDIRKKHPNIDVIPLELRLIKYTINDIIYTIGTTLLDNEQYKADEFPDIYHSRWGIEELYKISKVLIDVEDFHAQSERGVKQELFAQFVIITMSRIFANQTNDILLLSKNTSKPEKMKANFKNCLTTMARNIEGLFLQQIALVKNTIIIIGESLANCFQKERPNRSYERVSHKPIQKWKAKKNKSKANGAAVVA